MGEDMYGATGAFPRVFDHGQAVFTDAPVDFNVLVTELFRQPARQRGAVFCIASQQRAPDPFERPGQVDGGGPRRFQSRHGLGEFPIAAVGGHGQGHTPGRRGADQRRATHAHGSDRFAGVREATQAPHAKCVGQFGLVDDLHGRAVVGHPDRAVGGSVHIHGAATLPQETLIGGPASRPPCPGLHGSDFERTKGVFRK